MPSHAAIDFSSHAHPDDPRVVRTPCYPVFRAAARHPGYSAAIWQPPKETLRQEAAVLRTLWPSLRKPLKRQTFNDLATITLTASGQKRLLLQDPAFKPALSIIRSLRDVYAETSSHDLFNMTWIGNWRTPDGFHSHPYPVLNRVFFDAGTLWPRPGGGHANADEGDYFFMKPYFEHSPQHGEFPEARLTLACVADEP